MSERKRRSRKAVVQQVEGTKSVWITPFKGADEIEAVEKSVHIFETDPAFVRVAAGQTINLGDYQSLRVDVAVTMPCYRETVDETQKEVAEYVAITLETEIDKYLGDNA